jgi:hypothetical protein
LKSKSKGVKKMEKVREIPEEITESMNRWKHLCHKWWAVHYIIGISGLVSAITTASEPKFIRGNPHLLELTAWIAAICMGLVTFMMPSKQAKIYVNAWRVLRDSANRYRLDENFTVRELLNAAKRGEEIIQSGTEYR